MFAVLAKSAFASAAGDTGFPVGSSLWRDAQDLAQFIQDNVSDAVVKAEATRALAFYHAALDRSDWAPRLVVVGEEQGIKGLFLAKERVIGALPTGLYYADTTSSEAVIVAAPEHKPVVLDAALRFLFDTKNIRGLRLLAPCEGVEKDVAQTLAQKGVAELSVAERKYHVALPLAESFEAFKKTLGPKVRKNINHARNTADKEGFVYIPSVPNEEFFCAAENMMKGSGTLTKKESIQRAKRMFQTCQNPFMKGMKNDKGEWVSLVGGWHEGDKAWVFLQINRDAQYPKHSLSMAMRSHVIEDFIAGQTTAVNFWAGCGGGLQSSCRDIPTTALYLDNPSLGWRLARKVLGNVLPRMPRRVKRYADWVVPTQQKSAPQQSHP